MKEFQGAMADRRFLIAAIRTAFQGPHFNLCALHKLPTYDRDTFAEWVAKLHCEHGVSQDMMDAAKFYCVNYFLCPDCTEELEVEVLMRDVFPATVQDGRFLQTGDWKVVFSIGRYQLRKQVLK